MPFEIIMPRLGQITDEVEIIRWLKAEGEAVYKGDPLLEVLTDKATVEVESWAAGVLRRTFFKAGEKVPCGQVIAIITAPDEEWTPPEEETRFLLKNLVSRGAKKPPTRKRVKASPLAKKLAAEKGVDLSALTGSGPGGAISKEDVLKAAAVAEAVPAEAPAGRLLPLTSMRRAIGRRLVESKTTIPHFYVSLEADMSEAVKLRQALNEALEKRGQHTRIRVTDDTDSPLTGMGTSVKSETEIRISFSDILIAAVAAALTEFPQVNARLEEEGIRLLEEVNIGLAVSLEEGLMAPVIKAAHTKSVLQIARERKEVVARARAGRLRADELSEGSFTISNMGGYGVDSFAAIINPPQSAILAVGRIADRPLVVEGQIVVRPMMTMTLSTDHRLLDGALAATFLHRLKEIIERPQALLIDTTQL